MPALSTSAAVARHDVAVPGRRRRRPTGAPPPRPPRAPRGDELALVVAVGVLLAWVAARLQPAIWDRLLRVDELVAAGLDVVPARWARALSEPGGSWLWRGAPLAPLLILGVRRRFLRMAVYIAVISVVTLPLTIRWDAASTPSEVVGALALGLVGLVHLVVPGRWRAASSVAAALLVAVVSVARVRTGLDSATGVVLATVIGGVLPAVAFRRTVAPGADGPSDGRSSSAHLELGPVPVAAIREAVASQLGVDVHDVTPMRASGSSGSTPMVLRGRDARGRDVVLFGKLYASTHLRADRRYKLARSIRYGRLEDEHPFASVRRLVESEDYALRVAGEAGLPVPRSYGFVELTPAREYVLVTDWVPDSRQLDGVEVDGATVEAALAIVSQLWKAGIAHRDIKPANLLVAPTGVWLIDLSFAEIRPTAWREAVDLGNMLLVLSLVAPPEEVFEIALGQFGADELAEALATTSSVTIPRQLRARIRERRPGLVQELRAMAPARAPIAVQRWSVRRAVLTLALAALTAMVVALAVLDVLVVVAG